ncbi:hypothetical protein [Castellaniella caeni]|uniref:hypothetical protein n=1 Tax=Castellaniella caeni TaxID=266123 RepID=UPI000C9F9174|nr:hypothetical protein [Castellaniella caeni]
MSFGSNRPTFKPTPYGYTRRSRGIPRWLLLLITGIVLGAGGVLFLQRSYGPQRLTVEQSEQLRMDLNTASLENQRLATESKTLHQGIKEAQGAQQDDAAKIEQLRKRAADMEAGVASLLAAIPPDPRGSNPGIRYTDMQIQPDGLHYQVLLIQEPAKDQTDVGNLRGEVKLVGIGSYPNGNTAYVSLGSQPLDMGRYVVVQGQTELPKAYRLRQVTVQVMAEGSDKIIATRTVRATAGR